MRAKTVVFAITCAITLALVPSAHAGGGSWEFEGVALNAEAVLVSGEPVHAYAYLSLQGVKEFGARDVFWAGPEQGPFYGYIVSRNGPDWASFPPPLSDDALYVGDVVFSATDDPQAMDVTLDFVMPNLEPGYYGLVHCNDPCTRQIGDTMSTRITVVEDHGQAFIVNRMNHFDRRFVNLRARSGNRVHHLETVASRLSSQVDSMEDQISALARQVELNAQHKPAPSPSPWGLLAIGAGTALLLAAVVRAWFMRRPRSNNALLRPAP